MDSALSMPHFFHNQGGAPLVRASQPFLVSCSSRNPLLLIFGRHFAIGIGLTVFCVCCFLQPCLSQEGADPNPILQALRSKDYTAALADADKALAVSPKDCRILTMRGLALRGNGRGDDALESFRNALETCPQFVPALEGAAQFEYARRSPAAKPFLEQLISIHPEDPTPHAMLAVIDWQGGDCAAALPNFEKGGDLVKSNPEAEREHAACSLAEGNVDQAVNLYRQLMELSPDAATRLQFTVALWKAKRLDEALDTISPLIQGAAASPRALALAAAIAEEKGSTPQAVAWLRQAIVAEPLVVKNYVLFATIAFNHDSFQVGVDMINAGLRVLPGAAPLYLSRGVLRVQLSQFDAALEDFQEAHRLDAHLSFAEDAIGMIRSQQHDDQGSLEIFRKHAETNPRDPLLQYLLAEALFENANTVGANGQAEAIRAANRSIELEPDFQPARDLLAVLYLRVGNPTAARMQAIEALKRNPADTAALYQQIMADRNLGRANEIDGLVARLKQLKKNEQETKTKYLLGEVSSASTPNVR
jgi:tetratricopeptide (TPR) repeat protein